ncbi:MAG: heme-binding domain-containing protein [Bacteroidales bacterium]|nr:heme-binding domain-containing protein [Bacteroidales bacterium]
MKRTITILVPAMLFVFSMSFMFDVEKIEEPSKAISSTSSKLEMPENIKGILDKSCMGCHNDASTSTKGKMKLNFDKFNNGKYSTGKQIAKLNGIVKSLTKAKMPPKKFLSKYPDRALSADDSKALSDWATAQATKLAGE